MFAKEKSKIIFALILTISLVMGMGMNIPESEGSLPKYASKAADFYWNYYDEKVNFTAFSVGYDIINYTWDFGDGNIAYGYKTTHVYTISGNHTITLLMKKSDGDFITVSHYLNMLDGEPNVDFYWSPETPTTQEIVYFFDNSTDPDGYEDIYNWTWVFGDGSVAYGKNVTHRFADDGTYDVTLVIRDHSSGGNSATKQINVLNVPPITDFYWTREGNEIRFLDYSIDPDGSIVNWTWDFGDGNVSYEQNPLHNYSFDKTYTVKLTIRDDDNEKNESVKVIDFANPLPTADFTWVPDYPTILDVVSFIDLSTDDGSIVNWTWDFGDGNVSYEKNPSHQFSHKKTYVVTLTVIDNNHGLSSISKELEVVNAPPVADFSWDPYYPVPGEIINFTDKSYDSDGSIVNWTWDFGDGNVSYERNTSHAYTKNGTYTVNLTVKDDDGDISWKRKEMLVVAEIYVDDDAPLEWYDEKHVKTIQEGINNATNHAFIYVLEGIYKENVIVDKPVFLAAENAIVDASAMGNAFTFLGGDIEMNGFSIQNASNASGIEIRSDNNTIRNCTFMDNKIGIYIKGGNNNSIFQNEIKECGESFVINGSHDNLINETQIHDSMSGITIIEGNRNSIYDNTFSYLALYAIKIEKGIENEIFHNSIKFNPYGIMILSDVTCFLTENTFIQNGYGIFLMTNNIVVEKDVFIKNDVGIYISGNDTEVKECNFFDGIYGIKIENATDAYLHDCTFSSASTAIFTQNCSNVNISHSTLNGHNEGIRSVFSENVKIFNCTSWGNEKGMDIENSTATIHTSIFYSNFYGFFIINSSFSLTNSSLNENQCGIFGRKSNLFINHTSIENSEKGVASFSSHIFVNDTDIENNTYGITIENATFGECIFSSFKENEYGICFLNSSFISISNSSFSNNTNGMYGENSENITSMNNTFFFNSKGITMKKSHFCKLIDQRINFNIYGMELIECTNFIITDNKIRENDFGLIFSQSPKNKLSSNQFTNNTYNFDMEGLSTTDFYEDIDTSNKINGEPLYYLVNESNTFIEEPAGYIALVGCANISLANAMISNNGEGFLVVEGDNISIKNCTFKDNIEGSFILSSMNLIFNQTNVYNNLNDGILFQSSYDVSLFGCSIYQNGQRGINIYSLDEMDGGFSISGNEIKENWLGINIENTEGNLIQNNIIKNNGRGALRLFKASHTYIRDNNISANGYGIDIRECSDIYIFHDNLFSNENGIYLENSETRIQNSSFRECNAGIFSDASIINVENCTFFNNSRGMFLSNSSTHISLSSFINNTNGCEFISTSFNLSNSTLYGNVYGIISSYCTTGMIYCSRNIYGNEYAIVLNHSQNVNIFSCDVFNTTIGIYLINSLHNAIINCTIFNNTNGIVVINSTTNNISKCLVHHNSYGAKIEGDENTFYNNSFWKNDYGIWIDGGKHNTIYHNNFAYNTKNAHDNANNTWDNGYPSGGNYWSDYAGRDEFNGPHQNISGSDGIGDIPYKIGKSKDRYPLMELCEGAASIPNSPPIPSFMYYPRKPFSLEYVIFTDTSTDPNGKMDITTWHWDFGDGNTSDKQNPRHAYAHSGIYIITLTITDSYGEERNVTASIEIKNVPPTANFSWTPFSPNTQESVQFTDTSSDVDGSIVNYTWDFGDGSYSKDKNPTHTYRDNGVYLIKLTVVDNNGATSVKIQEISVKNVPPTAEFFFIPEKPSAGEEINFTDVSSDVDGSIVSWHWDFGDGTASNKQHPIHSYEKGGKYTITLTVEDDDGDEGKITKTIEIEVKSTPGFELIFILLAILFMFSRRKITFKK